MKTPDPQLLATHLGKGARAARERLGLTQEQVAERVGMSFQNYGRLERGKMPSLPTFVAVCRALKVSPDALIGEGSKPRFYVADVQPALRDTRRLDSLVRRARKLDARRLKALTELAALLSSSD
jgi:transcriptional regulator with XRE-family HTH domain